MYVFMNMKYEIRVIIIGNRCLPIRLNINIFY